MASLDQSLKVLVCGDVNGQFKSLFNRVTTINKKSGPFEMLLCVGDFFAKTEAAHQQWEDCVKGNIEIPVQTFVLGPSSDDLESCYSSNSEGELCKNVAYLGEKGLFVGSSGLKIVYLSGKEKKCSGTESHGFTGKVVKDLFGSHSSDEGVDILLTSQWPQGVSKYTKFTSGIDNDEDCSKAISQLALMLKPRYHFAGGNGIYFERQPYRNHRVLAETAQQVTRFIGLATYNNPSKQKFLYAFTITPMKTLSKKELTKQPDDVTECPYEFDSSALEARKAVKPDHAAQFFYDMTQHESLEKRGKKRHPDMHQERGRPAKTRPQASGPCWFCLGGKGVEKHLVVSVGESTYVALAKGGLVDDHVMILPIEHHQSITQCPDSVLEEVQLYKQALIKYFESKNFGAIFFERNYKTQHLQIQAVPYPLVQQSGIKEAILNYADSEEVQLDELPKYTSLKQIIQPGCPYFYLELDTEEKFLHRIRKSFPLQFGREIAASPPLLNMEERSDWKACAQNIEQETDLAAKFKQAFQPFDFNFM